MNYESEFQEICIEALKAKYGIEDESVLYHYFVLRFFIWKGRKLDKKENKTKELVRFLIDELNFPKDKVVYKDEEMHKEVAYENSMANMMESWIFENSIRSVIEANGKSSIVEDYISHQWKSIERFGVNKAKPFKNTLSHEWYWRGNCLKKLNEIYKVDPSPIRRVDGISYPATHIDFKREMEEQCEAWIHATEYQRSDVKTISEHDLENFLVYRLYLIEEGLTYVDRQFVIPEGRIDILAKDRNGIYVIIELKVEEDKELVWQCMYYPTQVRKRFGLSNFRMITLAPRYSESLAIALKQISYVEMMTFVPEVRLGTIEDIRVYKQAEKCA